MSWPCSLTVPAVGGCRPRTALPIVDLPEPDSPTRPTVSPGAMSKLTPSMAGGACRALRPRAVADDEVADLQRRGDDRARRGRERGRRGRSSGHSSGRGGLVGGTSATGSSAGAGRDLRPGLLGVPGDVGAGRARRRGCRAPSRRRGRAAPGTARCTSPGRTGSGWRSGSRSARSRAAGTVPGMEASRTGTGSPSGTCGFAPSRAIVYGCCGSSSTADGGAGLDDLRRRT